MDIKRLFDFPYHQLETHNLEAALVSKKNGEWVKTSTTEYLDKANAISRSLLKLGVQKNWSAKYSHISNHFIRGLPICFKPQPSHLLLCLRSRRVR